MNNQKIKERVKIGVENLTAQKGYVAPVDLLLNIGVLTSKDYEDWRRGKVPFLERVCKSNLSKMSLIMKELRENAKKMDLKPSRTVYKKWGKGVKYDLRFSKSGAKIIEEAYSTHYVNKKK